MRVLENGVYRDMTAKEKAEIKKSTAEIPYEQRVVCRIREKYSVDDELALLRQRVLKADEFEEYNTFVEKIKEEERNV
ncbi:MAG: hypothetical protein IIW94_03745 [Clostridia bacterium]|nr:hypothetical protein [Clostridia bacterium]